MSRHQLDARRLLCPMPVIRTEAKVADLQTGDQLDVVCTDRGVLHDIPAWCRVNGHRVIASHEADGIIRITVEVGA